MKITRALHLSLLVLLFHTTTISYSQISNLEDWLAIQPDNRTPIEELSFSKSPLSKEQWQLARELLLADKQEKMLDEFGSEWDNRMLTYSTFSMPFYYQIFGALPSDGRSLFISLHGGGGTTNAANNQ